MRAIRFVIAALALLWVALVGQPAFAQITPGAAAVGAPAPDAAAPAYSFDFGTGTYSIPFATAFTFTRASPKTNLFPASPPGFVWTSFANDVMVTDLTKGVNIERANPFNYYPFSTAPGDVVTTTSLTPGDYVLWITSSDSGGKICATGGTALISNGRKSSLAGEPSSDMGVPCARQNESVAFQVQTAGTVVLTKTGSVQTAQLENANGSRIGGTSFIVTGATPVQRAAEALDFVATNQPFTTFAPSTATNTFILNAQATEATQYTGILWALGNAAFAPGFTFTVGYSNDSNGVNQRVNTLGSGSMLSPFKVAIATSNSARKLMVNGGASTGGSRIIASTLTLAAQTRFGGSATYGCNCWVRSWEMYPGVMLTDWQMRQKTTPAGRETPNVIVYGDSLSSRVSPVRVAENATMWSKIETLSGGRYRFLNATREGNQFADGKADQLAIGDFDKVTVIWLGTNVGASANAMMADLATMVSLVKNGRYLIVSALNYSDANGQSGGSNWSIITDFNNQAAALYGAKFLNLRGLLVNSAEPGNARDAADAALDVPVSSTRYWLYQGALMAPIDATQTTWSQYPNPGSATVMIGNEILTPTTRSGANVTLGVRGVNGSTATAHPQGALVWTWDTIHQSDRGVTIAAQAIMERLDTLYGASLSYGLDLPALPGAANDNDAFAMAA